MSLQESGEMYLETIYILSKKNKSVRAIDVGEYMNFSKPSVSRAVGLLKTGGYIISDNDGHLELTSSGFEVAKKTYERHTLLTKIFIELGVDEETATEDACKIEHNLSDKTFKAIKKFASNYNKFK